MDRAGGSYRSAVPDGEEERKGKGEGWGGGRVRKGRGSEGGVGARVRGGGKDTMGENERRVRRKERWGRGSGEHTLVMCY